jgi:DhnA family fructose-bisphosphate aldolase class Ia
MMMKMTAAVLAVALTGSSAMADSMNIAVHLGSVIGSEEFCELSYNHEAIEAYIEKHVDADDMGFPSMLNMMTDGQQYQHKDMSKSQAAAHCAQIRRVARSYEFIAE